MGTFLVLLLTAVVVAACGGFALLPALLVIGVIAFAIWLVSSVIGLLLHVIGGVLGMAFSLVFGVMALLVGFVLLPLVFPLLLLAGVVYLLSRNHHSPTPAPVNPSR